jgi:hypothetical protein
MLREACSQAYPESAICVQRFDDSLNSAIRITYRILLRSSSLGEPRYPLLRVVFWLFQHAPTPEGTWAAKQDRFARQRRRETNTPKRGLIAHTQAGQSKAQHSTEKQKVNW